MPKINRTILVGVATAIVAMLVVTTVGRRIWKHPHVSADILSIVPSDAPMLGFIDLSALRRTQFYPKRPDGSLLWMPGGTFVNLLEAAEVNSREEDLDRIVIASWPGKNPPERGKTIAVAEGRFDSAKIRDYATQHGTMDRQQGREVYSMSGHIEGERNSLMFLDDSHIALINSANVAPLLDGNAKNSTGPMWERANEFRGTVAFLIIHFPEYPDILTDQGTVVLQSESLARMVDWGSLSLRPDGQEMRLSFEGECKTRTDAQQLQSTIELFRRFFGPGFFNSSGGRQFDPVAFANLQNQLRAADVKVTDAHVEALLKVSPDVWKLFDWFSAH